MTESSSSSLSPGEKAAGNSQTTGESSAPKNGQTTATQSNAAPETPPEIGDMCEVVFRDKLKLRAEVVERRPLQPNRRRTSNIGIDNSTDSLMRLLASENDQSTTNTTTKKRRRSYKNDRPPTQEELSEKYPLEEIEYYIHYENHDRRLDEWITSDRFVWETLERTVDGGGHGHSTSATGEGKSNKATKHATSPTTEPKSGRRRKNAASSASPLPVVVASNTEAAAPASATRGGNWRPTAADGLQELEREHHEITKVKNIEKIFMGGAEVECWYYSPYPDAYQPSPMLYVCEFCLKYMRKRKTFIKHKCCCPHRTPPGREIYRELGLSVFEIDGKEHKVYCQNLCLLAKLFLDHKTLYYDVDPFYFYIICSVDDHGAHIVGYFSKEKVSAEGYNLACILTFPQHQQHGYGKFIISLSYELSKREEKVGSPEKPLSDLGKVSYRSYWTYVLLHLLAKYNPAAPAAGNPTGKAKKVQAVGKKTCKPTRDVAEASNLTIKDISTTTGMKQEDIISTLQYLDMIRSWKGQHVVYVQQETIVRYMKRQNKLLRLCKPEYLKWDPSHYPAPKKKADKK